MATFYQDAVNQIGSTESVINASGENVARRENV